MGVPPSFLRLACGWASQGMLICRLRQNACFPSRSYLMSRMRRRTSAIHSKTAALYHDGSVGHRPTQTSLQRVRRWVQFRWSATHCAFPAHVFPIRPLALNARSAPRTLGCFCSSLLAVLANHGVFLRAHCCTSCNGESVSVGPQPACGSSRTFPHCMSASHRALRRFVPLSSSDQTVSCARLL